MTTNSRQGSFTVELYNTHAPKVRTPRFIADDIQLTWILDM